MNTASFELCKELFDLSGWWEDRLDKYDEHGPEFGIVRWGAIPAYDLGYLLRKLPIHTGSGWGNPINLEGDEEWDGKGGKVVWTVWYGGSNFNEYGDTPEDAAAKLAIELFKQGVLTREAGDAAS